MIITISGSPGSGKTTVAKKLSHKLKIPLLGIGEQIRKIAEKESESLHTLMHNKKAFLKVQQQVETSLEHLRTKKELIVDGRDAFFHLPSSFKIFLKVSDQEAARRIFEENRKTEHTETLVQALRSIKKRKKEDQERYLSMHHIDYLDEKNYDVVVDTSKKKVAEVLAIIITSLPKK